MLSNERIKPSPCGFAVYTVVVSSLTVSLCLVVSIQEARQENNSRWRFDVAVKRKRSKIHGHRGHSFATVLPQLL